ncbi:hypothetical protein [Streptomyces asiaticus]
MTSTARARVACGEGANRCWPGEAGEGGVRLPEVGVLRVQRLASATKFPATLLAVTIEDTSTRGILHLRNVSGELEVIRTDRGDSDTGAAMIERAQTLVGRRVLVYKDMEALASNPMHKVRVAVHLMDLGPETDSIGEDEAKGHVLQCADGDKDVALRAWQEAELPERGPVTAEQLGQVLVRVPGVQRP